MIKTIFSKKEPHNIIYKGTLVGCVGLLFPPYCNHDWGKDGVELGYWVGEEYQNKGIATKASRIVIKRAFKDLNIIFMRLIMYKISDQKRVLEKLWFKYYKDT